MLPLGKRRHSQATFCSFVFSFNRYPILCLFFFFLSATYNSSFQSDNHLLSLSTQGKGYDVDGDPITFPSAELLSKFNFLQAKTWDKTKLPAIDQDGFVPATQLQEDWRKRGYHIERNAIPDEMIDKYKQDWLKFNPPRARPMGTLFPYQYLYAKSNRDILCLDKLQNIMAELIGEPMGLHLTLTNWLTTTRDWHQDGYLNPDDIQDHYIAVWIALEDIHPDSGPFQFVPGSHRWGFFLTQEELKSHLTPEEANSELWPTYSEKILTPLFEEVIEKSGVKVVNYLPQKGDVLFWHSRLAHRGSKAKVPGTPRRALIGHFSGIHHKTETLVFPYEGGYIYQIPEETHNKKLTKHFEPLYKPKNNPVFTHSNSLWK